MNKTDIDYTEPKQATISLVVGDEVVDKNDNKATVFYIDYYDECVVLGSDGNSATVSFNIIAGGDYQQVVGDQIVLVFLLLLLQIVDKESIIFALSSISLAVGDEIVDIVDDKYKIAYIDYNCGMVVLNGNGGSDASVLNFNYVARNFKRVVRQNFCAFGGLITYQTGLYGCT